MPGVSSAIRKLSRNGVLRSLRRLLNEYDLARKPPTGELKSSLQLAGTVKIPRSRYVPVRRNFAVFCVSGVSKNQYVTCFQCAGTFRLPPPPPTLTPASDLASESDAV